MAENHLKWYNETLRLYLKPEELQRLTAKSDRLAFFEILHTWIWIAFAFSLPYFFPYWYVFIISLFILGGKQLACAIILHDCSHDALFQSKSLNRFFGNWLGAYPIFHDLDKYRPYHVRHHMHTGLDTDPDLSLTHGYPAGKRSLLRKFLRDFSGLSGMKSMFGLLLMQAGFFEYALNGKVKKMDWSGKTMKDRFMYAVEGLSGPLLSNVFLFFIFLALDRPELYLLWPAAMLTTFNFCLRVRSMAEHSMVADRSNPHKNSRTTYAGFIERILFAPHHVNYHSEHHLCMGAPSYHLPEMHRLLKERGYYGEGSLAPGYLEIVRMAL